MEVDSVLEEREEVSLAVTFPSAHPIYGEEVHCAVVLHDKYRSIPPAEIEKTIDKHCREKLPEYARPKKIHVVEDVPRTATGKIQRRIVAAHFASLPAKL